VRRLTFSRAIAELVQRRNPDHDIWQLELITGQLASSGSTGCLFGISDARRPGRLLRVAVTWEEAAYLAGDASRVVVECRVLRAALAEPRS
jgi:hypothetical protein